MYDLSLYPSNCTHIFQWMRAMAWRGNIRGRWAMDCWDENMMGGDTWFCEVSVGAIALSRVLYVGYNCLYIANMWNFKKVWMIGELWRKICFCGHGGGLNIFDQNKNNSSDCWKREGPIYVAQTIWITLGQVCAQSRQWEESGQLTSRVHQLIDVYSNLHGSRFHINLEKWVRT